MQQEKLFKPIVTNTLISLVESGQLVLPKWDALFKYIRCFPWFLKLGLDNCLILTWDIEILGWCPDGASLTSRGEGASLALVVCLSSESVTLKMRYGVDVLHQPALHPIFSYWVG